MSDPGPRQEVEKAKLSGNRRGVGWVHSTGETLEQSREERWRRGRREGTQSEEEVDAEARPGRSAGFGVSQEALIRGLNLNGPPKPRTSITLTSDKSPVRESRTPGSEGEVPGNRHLYPTNRPWIGASASRQSHSGSRTASGNGGAKSAVWLASRQRQKFATGPVGRHA